MTAQHGGGIYKHAPPKKERNTTMKKIVIFMLALCMVLTVAACANTDNNVPEPTETESTKTETTVAETETESTKTETTVAETEAESTELETTDAEIESDESESDELESDELETTDAEIESDESESNELESDELESGELESGEADANEPIITLQEVYDAGKNMAALLGDHDNVLVQAVSNGSVLYSEFLNDQYYYCFYDAEYMGMGFSSFANNAAEYSYVGGVYNYNVTLTPDGLIDMTNHLAEVGEGMFLSDMILNDPFTVTEENGSIIVTVVADMDEVWADEDVVSCVEIYTLDAATRELTAVQTVYTFEDGTTEEGTAIITRDVEAPEGVEEFLAYAEAENHRTITVVSNPGEDNEKVETVQVAKGLLISVIPYWEVEDIVTLYLDADCTELFEGDWDADADLTVYAKWGE